MGTLSVRLPNSLHDGLKDLAKAEGVSINHLITIAVSEKMSALMTEGYLEDRARLGSRERFEAVLSKVPDAEPDPQDRWDSGTEP